MASFHPSPAKPRLKLPRAACDTHFHVFGPRERFPYAADRSYTPAADAPKETLFALHSHLGIERGVVVQSAAHGYDNRAAADLIQAGEGSYVGVALVPTNIGDEELGRLDAQGFCGARFHYMEHLGAGSPIDQVIRFGSRLAALGWHLQIHLDSSRLEELAPALKRSPAAPWKDAIPFARKLVAEFGQRTLWGTDWPHPNLKVVPDDGLMVDLIGEIAPTEAQREALLVDNPQRFYGFE